MNIYLIGSLRNPKVPHTAERLRSEGFEVYDDWFSDGYEADVKWNEYEHIRGRSFQEALEGWHATHVFENDMEHLEKADAGLLMLPAGRSAHLELGWIIGTGKPGYILLEGEPERFDIMYRFASVVTSDLDQLISKMKRKDANMKRMIK